MVDAVGGVGVENRRKRGGVWEGGGVEREREGKEAVGWAKDPGARDGRERRLAAWRESAVEGPREAGRAEGPRDEGREVALREDGRELDVAALEDGRELVAALEEGRAEAEDAERTEPLTLLVGAVMGRVGRVLGMVFLTRILVWGAGIPFLSGLDSTGRTKAQRDMDANFTRA